MLHTREISLKQYAHPLIQDEEGDEENEKEETPEDVLAQTVFLRVFDEKYKLCSTPGCSTCLGKVQRTFHSFEAIKVEAIRMFENCCLPEPYQLIHAEEVRCALTCKLLVMAMYLDRVLVP